MNTQILDNIEINLLYKMINNQFSIHSNFSLLYDSTRDGYNAGTFHSFCDGHPNTVIIIKSLLTNNVFGGVKSFAWNNSGLLSYENDTNTFKNDFLYSLRRAGISETKEFFENLASPSTGNYDGNFGPYFGINDLKIDGLGNAYMSGWYYFKNLINSLIK
jgi:hypothetical protein